MASEASTFGNAHRFSPITVDDHAGYVWIVTILGMVYSGLAALTRLRIKWNLFGWDDHLLGVATFLIFVQSIVVMIGLRNGLGKSNAITSESQWSASGKAYFASELLAISILCLAKCSVVTLILRVFTIDVDRNWIFCAVTLSLSAAWGVASVVGLAVNCNPESILTTSNARQCPNQLLRWKVVTALDIVTELLVCALPVAFTWPTNMPLRLKAQVFLAFALRLPLAALSALHLGLLARHYLAPGSDAARALPLLDVAPGLLLQQVTLAYSVISATVPNLKSFMKSFSVGMGVSLGFIDRDDVGHHRRRRRHRRGSDMYPLRTMRTQQQQQQQRSIATTRSGALDDDDDDDVMSIGAGAGFTARTQAVLRPEPVGHDVTISHDRADSKYFGGEGGVYGDGSAGGSRSSSREVIIRKEVRWSISHKPV